MINVYYVTCIYYVFMSHFKGLANKSILRKNHHRLLQIVSLMWSKIRGHKVIKLSGFQWTIKVFKWVGYEKSSQRY